MYKFQNLHVTFYPWGMVASLACVGHILHTQTNARHLALLLRPSCLSCFEAFSHYCHWYVQISCAKVPKNVNLHRNVSKNLFWLYNIGIQLIQIELQWNNNQYFIIVCPQYASQRVEKHIQTLRNEFAHRKRVANLVSSPWPLWWFLSQL